MDIEKTYHLPFPPDEVYATWTSSRTVIAPATRMDIDPRIGGHYHLFIETADGVLRNSGTFSQVVPDHHLIYTWRWNDDDEVTTIDVEFSASAEGCKIDLKHLGFASEQSRALHDSGWDSYIKGLQEFMENTPAVG